MKKVENQSEQMKQVEKVTSNKSPGRIAAGKRLVEWNRQKKLNNQTKQKLLANEENEVKIPITKEEEKFFNKSWIIGGGLVAVGYGGYKLYKWYMLPRTTKLHKLQETELKSVKNKEEKRTNIKSVPDPFKMN